MKTNDILYLLIFCFTIISCDNLSEKEKNAQEYMEQIATNTNNMLKLPAKVDDFTFAEKVKFDKNTNTIIYSYVIDKEDYGSETEFQESFKQIESDQINRAKENQGKNPNYETLGIIIKSIYKNKENDILYSFDINPKDYIKNESTINTNEINKKSNNRFSDESFKIEFNNGLNYKFGHEFNKDKTKYEFSTISSSKTTTLNLTTNIGNPFGQIIEETKLKVEVLLKYKAGSIKFRSKEWASYLSESEKLKSFDVSTFFNENPTTNLEELQRYADYLDLWRENWRNTNHKDKEAMKRLEENKKFNTEKVYKYSKKDLVRLKDLMESFEKYFESNNIYCYLTVLDNLREVSPYLINTKTKFSLRLFNDFDQVEDPNNINYIPTINKFNVENAEVRIYMTASNTNGFGFNDLVKTINITDKWNNHFVKYSLLEN